MVRRKVKFEFSVGAEVSIEEWVRCNSKLKQDVFELVSGDVSEKEVIEYVSDMIKATSVLYDRNHKVMRFLMYDKPESMPADARVEFVYRPTYLAATFFMTAYNRYEIIRRNSDILQMLCAILSATLGRDFMGAGYDSYIGLLDTLEIFSYGDTIEFISKYPEVNDQFRTKLLEKIEFLRNEICTGHIIDEWSQQTYEKRGNKVLSMLLA